MTSIRSTAVQHYRKVRRIAKTRALLGYLLQTLLCFAMLGSFSSLLVLGLFPILGTAKSFWDLLLTVIFGWGLSLCIDYHKCPPVSCLPLARVGTPRRSNRSFFAQLGGRPWQGRRSSFWVLFSLSTGLLAIACSNLLLALLQKFFPWLPSIQMDAVSRIAANSSPPQVFLLIVLLPTVFEELVFRGRGFALLARCWGGVPAIIFSSSVFALVHFSPTEVLSLLPLSFYLGWLRLCSGSLAYTMLVHLLNNSLAFFALYGFFV